jgi:hypothetical protein
VQLEFTWPILIIGIGAFLLLFGLLFGVPGMAVPPSSYEVSAAYSTGKT